MRSVLLACSLLVVGALSGCTPKDATLVAVLAADQSAQFQQPLDLDALTQRIKELCEGCSIKIYDAASDATTQSKEFDQALVASADIVILDPVDPALAESLTQRAQDVPVISLGTLVPGSDWFVGLSEPASTDELAANDLEAAREVILRDRHAFTFVPAAELSAKAAEVAVGELVGKPVGQSVDHEGVPSWLFEPVEVTINDLTSVLVASGALTLGELCAGETTKRCEKLGLI